MRAPMTDAPADGCGVRRAEVGRPLRLLQLRGQALELAAADVLEVAARGRRRRLLVEEDGQLVPRARLRPPTVARQRDAVGHRHALDRHERDDVDGAEARVLARVLAQVDAREARVEERQHGGLAPASASPANV